MIPTAYDCSHPNFPYDAYLLKELARFEAAAKFTQATLASRREPEEQRKLTLQVIVAGFVRASHGSRAERDVKAHCTAMTPWPGNGACLHLVPPKKSTVAKVKKAKGTPGRKRDITVPPMEQQERPDPVPVDSATIAKAAEILTPTVEGEDKLIRIFTKRNRERLVAAYKNLLAKTAGSEDEWNRELLKFGKTGMNNSDLAYEGETAMTPDDFAQEFAIKAWKVLPNYRGTPEGIYPYLLRIRYNKSLDAIKEVKEENYLREPLRVKKEDEDGKTGLVDNPLLNQRGIPDTPARKLPEWITGTDRFICEYVGEGMTYKQIAKILIMSEAAVKLRIARMRNKTEEMQARGEL